MGLAPDPSAPIPFLLNSNNTKRQKRYIRLYTTFNSRYQLFAAVNLNFLPPSRFSITKPTPVLGVQSQVMAALPKKIEPKASALFVAYEILIYKHWRKTVLGVTKLDDDDLLLPTAFEYMDFLEWRTKQRAKRDGSADMEDKSPEAGFAGFVLAERCGHPIHPGDARLEIQDPQEDESNEEGKERNKITWCPMCTLQIHLKLLEKLWDKWLDSGGPWRILPPGGTGENFQTAKRAYYKRKTDFVNEIGKLDDIAGSEASWEAAHPAVDVEVTRPYNARTAMKVYEKSVQSPERVAEFDPTALRTPARKGEKKRLSYSPDTPEDTRHRANGLYARRHPSYDPESPYRCPKDDGWAETSFNNDWEYNVRQCRLLLCDKDPAKTDVAYCELTDDHSKDMLIKGIEEWFSMIQEDWKGPWVQILLTTTDLFVVWKTPPDTEESDTAFNSWDRLETLFGSNLEAHARRIGDLTDADIEEIQGEIAGNFFDQSSVASDSDSETDEQVHEGSDPMDLEEDENDVIVNIVGQQHQPDHATL
ncbi:hypothetical protein ACET3X_000967 [Alternaria dauci]|uniref:Uncharacterized protein n=1 Tax=Alternaria dauci TaxID=48095 RepID=A0ABR3UVV8_9PLEO